MQNLGKENIHYETSHTFLYYNKDYFNQKGANFGVNVFMNESGTCNSDLPSVNMFAICTKGETTSPLNLVFKTLLKSGGSFGS